jgi:L-aminopeptidase/D-esterase-like protein
MGEGQRAKSEGDMAAFSTRTANQAPQATAQKAQQKQRQRLRQQHQTTATATEQSQAQATFHPQTQRTTDPHQYYITDQITALSNYSYRYQQYSLESKTDNPYPPSQ